MAGKYECTVQEHMEGFAEAPAATAINLERAALACEEAEGSDRDAAIIGISPVAACAIAEQIRELVAAAEFYAARTTWEWRDQGDGTASKLANLDEGARARKALGIR